MTKEETNRENRTAMLQVYSSKDVEELLGLGKNTVNALLRSGRLRSVRCGKKYLIPRSAIDEFLNGTV